MEKLVVRRPQLLVVGTSLGLLLLWLGYFLPWVPHQAAALSMGAYDLSDWVPLLPQVQMASMPEEIKELQRRLADLQDKEEAAAQRARTLSPRACPGRRRQPSSASSSGDPTSPSSATPVPACTIT